MKITNRWLENRNACEKGIVWFNTYEFKTDEQVIKQLIKDNHYQWTIWVITYLLNEKDRLRFAIYCAKLALPVFEEKCPNDNRPRKAIKVAEAVLKYNSKKNRQAAIKAAGPASAAYIAAWSIKAAAYAAAASAYATIKTAATAYINSTYIAAINAANVDTTIRNKIINYGLKLLKENK